MKKAVPATPPAPAPANAGLAATGAEMSESLELRSEAQGSHWVAWATRPGESKPYDGALVVGRTREEAEERLKERLARPTG